jgi:gamma-tubulin complex component 3
MESASFRFRVADGMKTLEVNPSIVLVRPVWCLCRKMLELGDLHLRLCAMTNSVLEADSNKSLLHQALCEALRDQLRDYYRVLALLMAKVAELPRAAVRGEGNGAEAAGAPPLTLRRLWCWLQEPLERMRLLVSMCEVCLPLRGGALASAVYGFSRNGDAKAREACTSILRSVVAPLFSMIRVWMTEGELRDPFGEFFVCADSGVPLEEL